MDTIHYKSKLLWFFPRWVEAFVFGQHIFVRGRVISQPLLRHERVHVDQYAKYGVIGFLVRYIWYQIRYGYIDNPLEIEARRAER